MKQLALLSVIFLMLFSCTSKKIEFQQIESITINRLSTSQITLSANAVFKNPYLLGGTLAPDNIIVSIDGSEITAVQFKPFKVPVKDEFTVPLTVKIPFNKLPGMKSNNLISIALNGLTKQHSINFKGNLKYTILGITSGYSIDHTETLKLEL